MLNQDNYKYGINIYLPKAQVLPWKRTIIAVVKGFSNEEVNLPINHNARESTLGKGKLSRGKSMIGLHGGESKQLETIFHGKISTKKVLVRGDLCIPWKGNKLVKGKLYHEH